MLALRNATLLARAEIAADELRSSEERFRLLVDGVKDYAIFMLDETGQVTTWNQGAERIKGYRAREIIGRSFAAFYPPEAVAAGRPAYGLSVAEGGPLEARDKHRSRGKLLPRERIAALLDRGAFFLEFSPLAALGMYNDEVPGAGRRSRLAPAADRPPDGQLNYPAQVA